MNKAIFDGAPRQKVAALLADSQRFLPFRRRDALGAVVLPDGSISSDPDIMSSTVAAFWGKAVEGSNTHIDNMTALCLKHTTIGDASAVLRPTIRDIHDSIRRGRNSAPGPDGIRASVWSRFAPCVSGAFFEVVSRLSDSQPAPVDLNRCLAVYIPKKGFLKGPHGLQAKAGEARPLALRDSSSKIRWRSLARAVSPALKTWAHVSQRGFVSGRIPGHGVIDIDTSCRVTAVLHEIGVLCLYDFTSAFPTVSRSFILLVMQFSGFPAWSVALTKASWTGAKVIDMLGNSST